MTYDERHIIDLKKLGQKVTPAPLPVLEPPRVVLPPSPLELPPRRTFLSLMPVRAMLGLFLIVAACGAAGYGYSLWRTTHSFSQTEAAAQASSIASGQAAAAAEPVKDEPPPQTDSEVIARVARLIQLPDEKPTVALVSDLAPLKGKPFFVKAQLADAVLLYPTSHKAILYRPSEDKIIEVSTLTAQ